MTKRRGKKKGTINSNKHFSDTISHRLLCTILYNIQHFSDYFLEKFLLSYPCWFRTRTCFYLTVFTLSLCKVINLFLSTCSNSEKQKTVVKKVKLDLNI